MSPGQPQSQIGTHLNRCRAIGSGQAATELAKRYQTVIAQDPSQAMLDQATHHDNVRYESATAEATGQADCSVDLVSCAQAMHW